MQKLASLVVFLVLAASPASGVASQTAAPADRSEPTEAALPRPMELPDILAWRTIRSPAVSNDGAWFAYALVPTEGDSEVVVRQVATDTEHRIGIGERPTPFTAPRFRFSEDSRWLAVTVYAERQNGSGRRAGDRGGAGGRGTPPPADGLVLIELETGERSEFENVSSYAFAGERADWLAIHTRAPRAASGGDAGANRSNGRAAPRNRATRDPRSADLLLWRLRDGMALTVGNVAEMAFNEAGNWLALAISTEGGSGNGLQLRDLAAGVVRPLDSGEAHYQSITWTDEGNAFTVLKGIESPAYEDELYRVIGFRDLDAEQPTRVEYDPTADDAAGGMSVNPAWAPRWSDDREALLFQLREAEPIDDVDDNAPGQGEVPAPREGGGSEEIDTADLVIWHWLDRRLQSRQQVQAERDLTAGYLAVYRPGEDTMIRIATEDERRFTAAPKQRWAIGLDDDDYERVGNLDGRRYRDIWVADLRSGERHLAVEQVRWYSEPSPDGSHFLYFEDGHYRTYDMEARRSYNITEGLPVPFWNEEDDHNVVKPPISQRGWGWSEDGRELLLSDGWDVWRIPVHGGGGENLTVDGRQRQIRYQRSFRLDPDNDGIDLAEPIYLSTYGEWTKKGGIGRIVPGARGVDMLEWDDAVFTTLMKAKDADVYLYTRETDAEFPDFRVAGPMLGGGRVITDANPQRTDFKWSAGARLVDYTSAQGKRLQGALFLPADYEPGKQYPTIVYIYEKLSQGLNRFYQPTANGFNKSVYTSNGYAVLMPDISYTLDDPGMSAVWCVLPALDAAIETGVVDPGTVGLHGHSWGGYQTSFLVTQTERFTAAVAGAPLTNMISMYSLIYKNTGGGNGAIFESSQGRFTGAPWEVPDAYVRNSPVAHAANVETPLIILHNDRDGAVDFTQGVEYFNTLRRLEKPVVMLQYVGENHGLRDPANRKDYTVRMAEFFDHYLRDLGMPGWLREGVPHLQLEDHLEERARAIAAEVEAGRSRGASDEGQADRDSTRQPRQRPDSE